LIIWKFVASSLVRFLSAFLEIGKPLLSSCYHVSDDLRIGRRWGLIQDAAIMFIGLIMLTAAWGTSEYGWVICYALALFVYGIGAGGEYPMTATSGMENAVGSGKISTKEDRLHRGRQVTGAFLMQGSGQFFNQVILTLSLLIFHGGRGTPPNIRRCLPSGLTGCPLLFLQWRRSGWSTIVHTK
jgi:MFS family permease